MKRALISVSDKTGLVEFARFLSEQQIEILSTGGTAKALAEAGITVIEVSDYTGFPEMLDGRVKTLHPKIHGGLLGRRDLEAHKAAMQAHTIENIDLVVVNLYPFEATVAKGADYATCVENIDIGGPSMVRSAAKNHDFVTVIVDREDYALVQEEIKQHHNTTLATRKKLAAKAFARTASYDSAISNWFITTLGEDFPKRLTLQGELVQGLRYGENPHQKAAFYKTDNGRAGVATAMQLQGKELSYNNINDTDAAFELVTEFEQPAIAIIKHANPCGVAIGSDVTEAYQKALACDPVSAYGGIIAANRTIDKSLVEAIGNLFAEVIIAPDATEEAKVLLSAKKNLRLLLTGTITPKTQPALMVKSVTGGFLVQDNDEAITQEADVKVTTERQPTPQEMQDMLFAFTVAKHVKSNAIVLAKNQATVGIGAGQMSRIDSIRIACEKAANAGLSTQNAVLASDAFFPFDDNVHVAAKEGIVAMIHPGGSIRDAEVIKAADSYAMAMVLTGVRHFRH